MHPATFLNSFTSPSSFLVESLGSSMYGIRSPENNDSFTSSFPIWMPFISSCLIAMARTFSTMLNMRGESGHPCLVPDFKGNACSFCLLSVMLAACLSGMALLFLDMFPLFPLC